MGYNTTNGRAHNNYTTCCTTNSPPTDKNLPHPHIPTSWHVEMLGFCIAMWQICCTTSCRIVVSLSVGGVRVVEFGTYAAVPGAALRVMPVLLSISPVRVRNSKTQKRRKIIIGKNVPEYTSKRSANFQFKRWKVKVIRCLQPPQQISNQCYEHHHV